MLYSPNLKVCSWAYADSSWARVAALVPTVKKCAAAGDVVADRVLREAVEELVLSVRAVVKALALSGEGTNCF